MKCPACQGDGWTVEMDHDPSCDGNCTTKCPIQVQVLCEHCRGTGKIPDINYE